MNSLYNTDFSKKIGSLLGEFDKCSVEQIKSRVTSTLKSSSKNITKSQYNRAINLVARINLMPSKERVMQSLYDFVLSSEGMFCGKTLEKKKWFKGTAIGGMECSNPNR